MPANDQNPLCLTLDQVITTTSLGRTKIYELIKEGTLPIIKVGRRTLILSDDVRALLVSLRQSGTEGGEHAA
jgi:excisionase family DNA binding protein